LWGWDKDHFQPGNEPGIYVVDGFTIGTCICYEVRFPEFFRELFINQVDLALISFADVGKPEQSSKFKVIQSHIVSRAAENVFYVLTANSISQHQLASTGLVDPDGNIIDTAPLKEEFLLTAEIEITRPDFGRQGRISNSKALLK
jgi:predicted amidohydrolase